MAEIATPTMKELLQKYYREGNMPTIWCPGCGIGTITAAMVRAIDSLGLDQDKIVIVTGIGCSGFIYNYLKFDGFHGTHGRALAVATGIKLANPELHVIVPMGDGDCTAIGGNHFIHAARRNIDITAIVINNQIYGMTGGQYSPTTPKNSMATTAPYGHAERPFDVSELGKAAGATYVARGTVYHALQLEKLIANGIQHKGFSVVEVMSQCPVQYGRRNKMASAIEMLNWQKDNSLVAKGGSSEKVEGKFLRGELVKIDAPEMEYTYCYQKVIERAQGREGGEK